MSWAFCQVDTGTWTVLQILLLLREAIPEGTEQAKQTKNENSASFKIFHNTSNNYARDIQIFKLRYSFRWQLYILCSLNSQMVFPPYIFNVHTALHVFARSLRIWSALWQQDLNEYRREVTQFKPLIPRGYLAKCHELSSKLEITIPNKAQHGN